MGAARLVRRLPRRVHSGVASLVRFLRAYRNPASAPVVAHETTYARGSESLPATVYRPTRATGPLPGWVVLHGLTATGRSHASLTRFARAMAASGLTIMIPEIPEWRALRVAPRLAIPTIKAAVLALDERGDLVHGRLGLLGFSFGATQGLVAATDPALRRHLTGVAAWGGYCDLGRAFEFALRGTHELDGAHYTATPDPYGAWIMAGNYLTLIPGYEADHDVAAALQELALEAGRRGVFAGDPVYDPDKLRLRESLPQEQRPLFDLFAPISGSPSDADRAGWMAAALTRAALAVDPLLDPTHHLPHLRTKTLLAHGRGDRLIPYTETIRLSRILPSPVLTRTTITSLFAHSTGDSPSAGPVSRARESARFLGLLNAILALV